MKRILLFLSCLSICIGVQAQNWKTVRLNDTVYFAAGKHGSTGGRYYPTFYYKPNPSVPDSSLLRIMFITGRTVTGADSTFSFFTTVRVDTITSKQSSCVDTLAPSWLGQKFIRKADGTEYYFNNKGDSIMIRTLAQQGSNWIIAKDAYGRIFKGTVTAVGLTTVDRVTDSFKTISIQAYSGTTPVAHLYNSRVLQLSKNHGWLKTLDFFRFPNSLYISDAAIAVDSMQHIRLPNTLMGNGPETEDITWKYAPGNEWIWYYEDRSLTGPDQQPDSIIARHDSVLSFQLVQPDVGVATIRSVQFNGFHWFGERFGHQPPPAYFDSSRVRTFVHKDTVRSIVSEPFRMIENGWRGNLPRPTALQNRYFVSPFDTDRFLITRSDMGWDYIISYTNGCLRILPGLSAPDDRSYFETYVPGFGQTAMFRMDVADHLWFYQDRWWYPYIKVGGSIYGTKINVSKLDVDGKPPTSFSVYPNPANSFVTVVSSLPGRVLQVRVMSIAGQECYRNSFSKSSFVVPTKDLVAGMYFLEVSSADRREVFKVIVQH
jgi:hypothetical protein